mmetsp:Transcript_5085/g.6573  ORF Transcript_5085/g.6573 Transcript_5085/m.6573 type:complete len:102 (-) Transcript_5085:151-456(-)
MNSGAVTYLKKALSIEEKLSNGIANGNTALIHKWLGTILYEKRDYRGAFMEYQQALGTLVGTLESGYFLDKMSQDEYDNDNSERPKKVTFQNIPQTMDIST